MHLKMRVLILPSPALISTSGNVPFAKSISAFNAWTRIWIRKSVHFSYFLASVPWFRLWISNLLCQFMHAPAGADRKLVLWQSVSIVDSKKPQLGWQELSHGRTCYLYRARNAWKRETGSLPWLANSTFWMNKGRIKLIDFNLATKLLISKSHMIHSPRPSVVAKLKRSITEHII